MKSIIILHGALGSSSQFIALSTKLGEQIKVYNLNFPGHGGEVCNAEYSITSFSHFLLDFIKENKLKKPFVFGYSMGGYVALNAEITQPGSFAKILTLGTKFDWSIDSANKEIQKLNPQKIEEKIPAFAARLHEIHRPCDWKEVLNNTAKMMMGIAIRESITLDAFSKVVCPVYICRGNLDNMVTERESRQIADVIPDAHYVEIQNVQHPIDQVEIDVLIGLINRHLI